MATDAKLLPDRALDQAWRGGVGVAMAVTRAQELSDPLRLHALLEDAKVIVSDRHACSPSEASDASLLCVVVHQAPAPRYRVGGCYIRRLTTPLRRTAPPPVSTGSRSSQQAGPPSPKSDRKCANTRCRDSVILLVCRRCHRATVLSIYRPPPPTSALGQALSPRD